MLRRAGSGRIAWDERGNGIWEWQTAPGIYSREISAQQLLSLQAVDLELVDAPHNAGGHVFHVAKEWRPIKSKRGIWAALLGRLRG